MSALSRTALRSYARLSRRTEEVKGYLLDALRYHLYAITGPARPTINLVDTPINVFCPPDREEHPAQVLRVQFLSRTYERTGKEINGVFEMEVRYTLHATTSADVTDTHRKHLCIPLHELSVHDLHALLVLLLGLPS